MGYLDYRQAEELVAQRWSFAGLILAAMFLATDNNLEKLKTVWPDRWIEFQQRSGNGGFLPGED